jgi:cell shape-determining protein MreC
MLRPKGYAVERALNALLVGKEPQVVVSDYPSLSEHYQLTGTEPEAINNLFSHGLGDYLNGQIQHAFHRSIEGHENQFLYYKYLKKEIKTDELYQLYEESKHVLKLLDQTTTVDNGSEQQQ